jgi:hypothetical protein
MLDPHSQMYKKKNSKMNPKPTAGTYRGITKPKFTHSLVSKGTSMLDPHSQMYKKKNSKMNPKPTAGTYRGITKPEVHSLSCEQAD